MSNSVFKARVGSQYRVVIPPAERETLGIKEGDYVVVHVGKVQQDNGNRTGEEK